jgi:hypothetical protein
MLKPDAEAKRARRLEKFLSPLMKRRDFMAMLGIAGVGAACQGDVGKSSPLDMDPWPGSVILQQVTTSDQALTLAYWVFFEAAGEDVDGHNMDPLGDVMVGHTGGDDTGPPMASARFWLMWRLREHFRKRFNTMTWQSDSQYVLLKAARVGQLARKAAMLGPFNRQVQKTHAMDALHRVRQAVLQSKESVPFDLWCDVLTGN